jgi:hypothetical protein
MNVLYITFGIIYAFSISFVIHSLIKAPDYYDYYGIDPSDPNELIIVDEYLYNIEVVNPDVLS